MTLAATDGAKQTRGGIRIWPNQIATSWPAERLPPPIGDRQPARALDQALLAIAARYGYMQVQFQALVEADDPRATVGNWLPHEEALESWS